MAHTDHIHINLVPLLHRQPHVHCMSIRPVETHPAFVHQYDYRHRGQKHPFLFCYIPTFKVVASGSSTKDISSPASTKPQQYQMESLNFHSEEALLLLYIDSVIFALFDPYVDVQASSQQDPPP